MKIDVQIDVAPLLLRLRNGEKRLAYGVVNALNATARRIQDAERERVQSTFVLRKRDFILREIAKIRRTSFANVRQGRAWVEIEVGQKRRLLLSQFEAGGTRAALKGKRVAVPLTGGPARPEFRAPVPPSFTFRQLRILRIDAGKPVQTRTGRSRRRRADVSFGGSRTAKGAVQFKGAQRTFILPETRKAPLGGVFQRIGPGRDDVRLVYPFVASPRLEAMLGFVATAEAVARVWFKEEMEREAVKALARHG